MWLWQEEEGALLGVFLPPIMEATPALSMLQALQELQTLRLVKGALWLQEAPLEQFILVLWLRQQEAICLEEKEAEGAQQQQCTLEARLCPSSPPGRCQW